MRALFFIIGMVVASTLLAAELQGVKVPDTIEISGKKLTLNGLGVRKAFGVFTVYVGALYVEEKSQDAKKIIDHAGVKHLELHFKRYVERKKLVEAWEEGFKKNAVPNYGFRSDLNILNKAMTGMQEGQTIKLTFLPDKSLIQVDGKEVVTIEGPNFSKQMLSVFLGSPPNPELKSGLLGL
jgi:hypothetical protein